MTFVEAARRDQIVAAAVQVIAAHGFAKASFTRIAAQAGISPGLITYHFRAKDALLLAVVAEVDARLDAAMSQDPEPASYAEALERMLAGFVRHCAHHPDEMLARNEVLHAGSSTALRRMATEHGRSGAAELVAFLAEGQGYGEFGDFDAEVFADTLLAAMSAVPQQLRDRPDIDAEARAGEFAALFVRAALADARPAPGAR